MAGRPPGPPGSASDRNPRVHPWQPAPGVGWQHGEIPAPPAGMTAAGDQVWDTWMTAWWAAFWCPGDLPVLRLAMNQFDLVLQGLEKISTVTPLLDSMGCTPKGRQSLRWAPPELDEDQGDAGDAGAQPDDLQARRSARRDRLA